MSFPLQNIIEVIKALQERGITNPFVQIGILCTIAKESGFVPKSEYSYRNTSNSRLREIFGSRLSSFTDTDLTALKQNDVQFYDAIYGGRYGNTSPGDGYKYRGRGFNQITFKALYKKYGDMIGVDLISNPDRLNEPAIAAKVNAAYFSESFKNNATKMESRYGVSSPDQVQDSLVGVQVAVNANAGWGKDTRAGVEENKALSFFDQMLSVHNSLITTVKDQIEKKKFWIIAGVVIVVIVAGVLIYKYYSKK